ncbi:MAG: hypothetical protein AB7Q23_08260 [Hyphomonadaceae bacterium]
MASIESMIGFGRYGTALMAGDIERALTLGVAATSGARVAAAAIAGAQGLGRVDIAAMGGTPIADMIADPLWRDAVGRLPADLLVARRLQGSWSPVYADTIRTACARVIGDEPVFDNVLKAGTGRYVIGGGSSFNAAVAWAASRTDEQLATKPALRFHRDMTLVGHIAQSMARRALEPLIIPVLQRGWMDVLANQRFRMTAPMRHCPAIEAAVAELPKDGLRAAARLILAAAPAVAETLSDNWLQVLEPLALGGK